MIHKFKFWVKSSRMTDISEEYKIWWEDINITKDVIQDHLESWCEDVFPMFRFTDAHVTYGYEPISHSFE